MSREPRFAIPGEHHTRLPASLRDWTTVGGFVIPWRCPQCDQLVAESVVDRDPVGEPRTRTVLVAGDAVRLARFDRDGAPYYGPSRRTMRGKSVRRDPVRLRRESLRRTLRDRSLNDGIAEGADYAPIEAWLFDTVCDNCPLRVRIEIARR